MSFKEILDKVKELAADASDAEPTDQTLSHEGVLVSMYMRGKGKEIMGRAIRAKSPRSIIAEFHDGAWVKKAKPQKSQL